MNSDKHKAIFITGSSSGLGRAAPKLFASRGWKVIVTMRNPNSEKELTKIPGVTLMPLDTTDPQQIQTVAEQVVASGGVDVVFNNAGYGLAGPLEGLSDEQVLRMVNTNMLGPIRTTKAFIPHFREKRAGLFINTTSIGGLMTVPFNSIYHATKWALEGWSESMAFELNQFGIGLKVVEPGACGRHHSRSHLYAAKDGVLRRNDEIAGEGKLEAAAKRDALDGRDGRYLQSFDRAIGYIDFRDRGAEPIHVLIGV
jgi:NAD(P)-dependent dehydrogenase (short-subunit alcohol dehydrogenase family)